MKNAMLIVGMMLMLGLSACQNMGMGGSAMSADSAVVSTSTNGSVVYLPNKSGGVQVLATSGTATLCEQCKMDAASYFSTGKIADKCSVCGATRSVVRGR